MSDRAEQLALLHPNLQRVIDPNSVVPRPAHLAFLVERAKPGARWIAYSSKYLPGTMQINDTIDYGKERARGLAPDEELEDAARIRQVLRDNVPPVPGVGIITREVITALPRDIRQGQVDHLIVLNNRSSGPYGIRLVGSNAVKRLVTPPVLPPELIKPFDQVVFLGNSDGNSVYLERALEPSFYTSDTDPEVVSGISEWFRQMGSLALSPRSSIPELKSLVAA